MRIGSLCSGYAGLDMGLRAVIGGTVAWHADDDPAAAKVLAHHWPQVPNLGDITAVDWAGVEPVDWLTAGFPCQPVSVAGRRRGTDDERWLWDHIAAALGRMDPRPRMLLLENVPGLLTANGGDAMARVVHDLAALGYVGRVRVVAAADAGAPHGRARVFVVAADTTHHGRERRRAARDRWSGSPDHRQSPADANDAGLEGRGMRGRGRAGQRPAGPGGGAATPAHPEGDGRDERRAEPAGLVGGSDAALSGAAADAEGFRDTHEPICGDTERQHVRAVAGAGGGDSERVAAQGTDVVGRGSGVVAWGPYEPAVRRWERTLGHAAPVPTEPGRNGQPRLSPRFVEWLMGLSDGHVTAVPGLTRNDQLRLLGNGCVPQQVTLAVQLLFGTEERAA